MNRRFDAGLRGLHLQLLDRDLDLARGGVLGTVVPATDWQRIRRNWRYPPNIATVIVHDVPMSDDCGTHRLPGGYLPPPRWNGCGARRRPRATGAGGDMRTVRTKSYELKVSGPTTQEAAEQIGKRFLAELMHPFPSKVTVVYGDTALALQEVVVEDPGSRYVIAKEAAWLCLFATACAGVVLGWLIVALVLVVF